MKSLFPDRFRNVTHCVLDSHPEPLNGSALGSCVSISKILETICNALQGVCNALASFFVGLSKSVYRFRQVRVHKVGDILTYRPLWQRETSTGRIAKIAGDHATLENGEVVFLPKIQTA